LVLFVIVVVVVSWGRERVGVVRRMRRRRGIERRGLGER